MDDKRCLTKEEKPSFKHILEQKIESLKEQMDGEAEFYKENGLYNEKEPSEIEEELNIAKKVLKHLDDIPECGKKTAM